MEIQEEILANSWCRQADNFVLWQLVAHFLEHYASQNAWQTNDAGVDISSHQLFEKAWRTAFKTVILPKAATFGREALGMVGMGATTRTMGYGVVGVRDILALEANCGTMKERKRS